MAVNRELARTLVAPALLVAVVLLTAEASASESNATALSSTTCDYGFHYLAPELGAPPNGGSVNVGDRFTLELRISAKPPPQIISAQQARIFWAESPCMQCQPLLQNVRADRPGCEITNTVTPITRDHNAVLENFACNGPGSCTNRGRNYTPGSIAYASGDLQFGGSGDFQVARIGLCAVAPGTVTLRWLFSPAEYWHTQFVDWDGNIASVPACYRDYVIKIVEPTD